jgi:hypothetical protein
MHTTGRLGATATFFRKRIESAKSQSSPSAIAAEEFAPKGKCRSVLAFLYVCCQVVLVLQQPLLLSLFDTAAM